MAIRIGEEPLVALANYASIPASFLVERRFVVRPLEGGLAGLNMAIEPVEPPYLKDYDLPVGEGPADWADRWDLSNWGVISAFDGDTRVAGAAIAWNTSQIDMLGGRKDIAALWDIRVHPGHRRRGLGSRLFAHATEWTRARGCVQFKVETQNVNVPACHFYARQGCTLAAINPFAYPDLPSEVQFIWVLRL